MYSLVPTICLTTTQCDQIGQYIALWGTFQSLWHQLFCQKLPTFLGYFCKGVEIFHFSSGIIFGKLLSTFGDFLLVTLLLPRNGGLMVGTIVFYSGKPSFLYQIFEWNEKERSGIDTIKIFSAFNYATLIFKHSDWLNIFVQPIRMFTMGLA